MMKIPEKIIVLYICIYVIVLSCTDNPNKEVTLENEDTIDIILIQFYPAFDATSLMLLDLSKKQQTFRYIEHIEFIPKYKETIVPENMHFKLDSLSYSYFRNISFNVEDFIDTNSLAPDGIAHSILYVFNSGRIEDVNLKGGLTKNTYKLITKLIDLNIAQSTDSLTTEYLKILKQYHN